MPSPGSSPGRSRPRRSRSCSCPGTVPTQKETIRVAASIDKASGLLWREGCAGPKVTKGFFNLSEVESNFPAWQRANANWGARAAKGSGVRGGPKGTRTAYFYNGAFTPFGRSWGAPFKPTAQCPLYTPPQYCNPFAEPTPTPAVAGPPCVQLPTPPPPGGPDKPFPTRKPRSTPQAAADPTASGRSELDDRRPVAALAALAGPDRLHQRMTRGRCAHGVAERAGAQPVDDQDLVEARQRGIVEVAIAARRAPRPPALRAGRATTRPTAPDRGGARPHSRWRPSRRHRHVRPTDAGPASAGTRSSTSTVTRIPPASSVARRPARSRATIRPSQPPDRLRARSPSGQVCGTGAASTTAGASAGSRSSVASARSTAAIERRGRDGLPIERLARRGHLGPQVGHDPLRLGARGADRLVALLAGAPPLLLGGPQRLGRPQLGVPRPVQRLARLALGRPDRGQGRLERALRSRSAASARRSRSPRAGPAARRSRTPGCRPAGRSSAGRSATASRGRTRRRRCAPRAWCGRTP